MAVNYDSATKSARMAATILQIDANASPAFIEICTAAYAVVLATITLSDPSFTESGGVITMIGAPKSGVASGTGTAAVARIKDGGGTTKVNNLTVGAGSGEISLDGLSIVTGQTVNLNSATITHQA